MCGSTKHALELPRAFTPFRAARPRARCAAGGVYGRRRRRLRPRRPARVDASLLAGCARRRRGRVLVPTPPGAARMRVASTATQTLLARAPAVDSVSAALLACGGAAVAATTLFADRLAWPAQDVEFARTWSFLLYAFLIIGQVAIWPVAIAWLWSDLRTLGRGWRRNARELIESLAILALASWAAFLVAAFGPK